MNYLLAYGGHIVIWSCLLNSRLQKKIYSGGLREKPSFCSCILALTQAKLSSTVLVRAYITNHLVIIFLMSLSVICFWAVLVMLFEVKERAGKT